MKTCEWNENQFNFDEELNSDLATDYETADNILESLSAGKRERICLSVFRKTK
jgi:hypothetical protein